MLKKFPTFIAILTTLFLSLSGNVNSAANNPRIFSERFVLRALRALHGAQATYQATTGNGNFGTLNALGQTQLIDAALATGDKYGYVFVVTATPFIISSSPATFTITATPRTYRKTGRTSFFIDTSGDMRGADKLGEPASESDPEIDDCANGESCTIQSLRMLHGAEATFQATSGNGNFGSLSQLGEMGLISGSLADGLRHGYSFTVTFVNYTPGVNPATFKISAVPQTYGVTGIRSFFIATDGIIHGADKNGAPADENDPPINE